MSFRARQPGCPCCDDDCLIPIEGWEEWSMPPGTGWTISADGTLITTPDTGQLLTAFPDHPEDKSTHVVEVTVRGEDDGDILRVIVTFDLMTQDRLYAEIEVGTVKGYLRLFQVVGGATFQLGDDVEIDPLAPATDHAVKVCYDGEVLMAIVNTDHSYARVVTATGEYVGLATGAITTLATFKNFRWWIHYDDGGYYGEPNKCPKCSSSTVTCGNCPGNSAPKYVKAVISGVSQVDANCNCDSLNGTFIIPFMIDLGNFCSWYILPSWICSGSSGYLELAFFFPTGPSSEFVEFKIEMIRFDPFNSDVHAFRALRSPFNCLDFEKTLTWVSTTGDPYFCEAESATIKVTPL